MEHQQTVCSSSTRFSKAFLAQTVRHYVSDPWRDSQIKSAYDRGIRRGELRKVATTIGWPTWAVRRRARELGVSHTRSVGPWSAPEIQILEGAANLSGDSIQRRLAAAGFTRSLGDIARELRHGSYRDDTGYTMSGLAALFGVDLSVVRGWIEKKWLRAARNADTWHIRDSDIRRFVADHPLAFRLGRVDQLWILHIIFDGRICRG
jgi:hypothetical protein